MLKGLCWLLAIAMFVLPWESVPGLPSGVRVSDAVFLLFMAVITERLVRKPFLVQSNLRLIPAAFFSYVAAILLLPLGGILLLGAPATWYLGDARWLQVLALMLGLWVAYEREPTQFLLRDYERFLALIVALQIPFVVMQAGMIVFGWSPSALLELWYSGGDVGYGSYGQYLGRFAGAMMTASGLAFVAGMGFLVSGFRMLIEPTAARALLLVTSLALLVAAGNRAMLMGTPVLLILISCLTVLARRQIKARFVGWTFLGFLLLFPLGITLHAYDIGRLASSDRYLAVLDWLTGGRTFESISGRGGDTWMLPLIEAYERWTPLGTLVNSSQALDHLPVMDSYFVVALAQAGPIILSLFLATVGLLLVFGVALLMRGDSAGSVLLGICSPVLLSSVTQNTMTGLPARIALMCAVVIAMHRVSAEKLGEASRAHIPQWGYSPRAGQDGAQPTCLP